MRTASSYLIALCLALWLGGLVTLLMSLMAVFRQDHALGSQVGPILFSTFEPYQLALGAISTLAAVVWRLKTRSMMRKLVLVLVTLASLLAVFEHAFVLPRMIELWDRKNLRDQRMMQEFLSGSPTTAPVTESKQDEEALKLEAAHFQKLHQASRYLYTTMTVLVLLAGGAYVNALRIERDVALPRPTDRD